MHHQATIGGGVIQEHPTIMTSQPEIFNRNEDEEIDEDDEYSRGGGNQNYRHYQYMEQQSDSQINHRAGEERSSVGTIMDRTQQQRNQQLMTQTMRNSN